MVYALDRIIVDFLFCFDLILFWFFWGLLICTLNSQYFLYFRFYFCFSFFIFDFSIFFAVTKNDGKFLFMVVAILIRSHMATVTVYLLLHVRACVLQTYEHQSNEKPPLSLQIHFTIFGRVSAIPLQYSIWE